MRDSITVNIRPEQRELLGALAHIRRTNMYELSIQACEAYLATPPPEDAKGLLRDPLATFRFSMRIPPDLQRRLEDRAAVEVGEPRTAPGEPGRKTYKATIIRRAITALLTSVTMDEQVRMDLYIGSTSSAA